MSWQALTWAADQKTGSPSAKLLLLLLANRADESGVCWPSQISLATQAEQSEDTVQRHLKALEKGGFIVRARTRRTLGRWAGYVYQLLMPGVPAAEEIELQEQPSQARVRRAAVQRARTTPFPAGGISQHPSPSAAPTTPQPAARTTPQPAVRSTPQPAASPHRNLRPHYTANCGVEPVIEPSIEPSEVETSPATAAAPPVLRPRALQRSRPARLDIIHSEIAQRLGDCGWSILQRLSPDQLAQIEGMHRKGNLSEGVLQDLRNEARLNAGATA